MKRVVSIATYLESYNITRKEFDEAISKDKDFYDDYIQWGSKKDGTDSVISPKALDRLGEVFNGSNIEIKTKDKEEPQIQDKPKRKRRTKAEMEAARQEEKQIDMSEFMDKPEQENKTASPKKASEKATKPRKKKTKLNITRQFIQEHGRFEMSENKNMKELRLFLMNGGLYKAEQIALMSDNEVTDAVLKDYYFIEAKEGTYIIKRSVLTGNVNNIYVIEQ